jgi:hypothetical protein
MDSKICPQCGNEFEGRANKLYCSTKCKMAAFYGISAISKNALSIEPSTDNGLTVSQSEKPLTLNQNKNNLGMVTIPVSFTIQEKELLEKQAGECETVLSNLIRIRCMMDETDIRMMQQTLTEQKQLIEELRIKLSFYQEKDCLPTSNKQLTDKPINGLLIEMNERQLAFIREKYLESYDFENPNEGERMPNGKMTSNHCEALEAFEKETPGFILSSIEFKMLYKLLVDIEERLAEYCGYDAEEFEDNPLIDEFDSLKKKV